MDFCAPLVEAKLLRRLNRFIAEVEVSGELEPAHVPNTGRLRELLVEGAKVFLKPVAGEKRQTRWALSLVQKDGILCAVDTRLPAQLLLEPETRQVLGLHSPACRLKLEAPYNSLFAGTTALDGVYGNHRFDLLAEEEQGRVWVEAKTVSLVVNRQAYFPDAPTKRGASHLHTLAKLVQAGDRGAVVFMLLRDDADAVHPNDATDPAFADALRQAAKAGVMLRAIRYSVTLQGITFDQEVPVVY